MDFLTLTENMNLEGHIMIIPAVSVGNVGQLAVDLLIEKLEPCKIGSIWHCAIMPMVGGHAHDFNNPNLTTGAEVLLADKYKAVIIQFRSPVIEDESEDFIDKLMEWVKENGIFQVIILTGNFDHIRSDSEIAEPPVKYILSPNFTKMSNLFSRSREDQSTSLDMPVDFTVHDMTTKPGPVSLQGGGISLPLHNACIERGIPSMMIMKYCSEGDNVPDAIALCVHLNKWMNFAPQNWIWQHPLSWRNMFGVPPEDGLF